MTLIDQLKRDRLVVIARGIPTNILLRAAEACAGAGVAFLESTFDPLMATGGVNPQTIPEFLKRGVVAVGTGITILRPDLVEKRDYDGIGKLAKVHIEAISHYPLSN